jgi:hypothetical protein
MFCGINLLILNSPPSAPTPTAAIEAAWSLSLKNHFSSSQPIGKLVNSNNSEETENTISVYFFSSI